MDKAQIFFCIMIGFNIACIAVVIACIVMIDVDQLNTKTISLKESEYKCTLIKRSKARDGCLVYKYIGGIEE